MLKLLIVAACKDDDDVSANIFGNIAVDAEPLFGAAANVVAVVG